MESAPNYLYKTKPYKHQEEAVYKCYPLPAFALFMEQGTGKTKTDIDLSVNLFKEGVINAVLLIAPSGVQEQWADKELPKHHPDSVPYVAYVWDGISSQRNKKAVWDIVYNKKDALVWFCVNVEAFSSDSAISIFKEFVKNHKTHIIVDEATTIKNPDARRSLNIIHGLSALSYMGKRLTKIAPLSVRRSILTGTMVTNSPYDIWNMFEFLEPGFFGMDFFSFKMRYGIERKMSVPGTSRSFYRKIKKSEIDSVHGYHKIGKSVEDIAAIMSIAESSVRFLLDNPHIRAPYKNLEQLKAKIAPVSVIVKKSDCLDLPPKIYEELRVTMSVDQARVYKEMKRELFSEYEGRELTALNKISLILRLQQITGGFFPCTNPEDDSKELVPIGKTNPKIEALISNMDECADRPVIISARFTSEVLALRNTLRERLEDERVECIYGNTPIAERRELRDAFERNEIDIFIVSPLLVRRGFNFQNCHIMYLYSNDYSLETREQLEDRIHRDGQLSNTIVYKDIIMKGTVDEQVLAILRDKRDLLEYMREASLEAFLG